MSVSAWVVSANINLPSCTPSWNYLVENRISTTAQRVELAGLGIFRTSLVITCALIQETHPVLGMEKLMWVYKAEGWYHLRRKPGKLFYLITPKPLRLHVGCVNIYYENVPQSSKYLLWKNLVLTYNKRSDFCQGQLQSACQWVAVVHTSSVFGLKMCHGTSGTSRLTGGEDTQAIWFSKLISIKHSPAVVSQFKTHATEKLDSSHLQGIAGGEPDGGWGSLDMRCYGKGELLPKICQSGRGGLVISCLHCSWWLKSCCHQRGQDFTLHVYPVDTGPN